MKEYHINFQNIIIFFIIFSLFIISCPQPQNGDDNPPDYDNIGELFVTLIPPSFDYYGLDSNNHNSIKSYTVELQKPGQTPIKKENITNFPIIFEMISVGSWSVHAYAINEEEKKIGFGLMEAMVEKYTRTQIEIPLSLSETGNGLLSASFLWPEDVITSIHAVLEDSEEQGEEILFSLFSSGAGASYIDNYISAGAYTLTVDLSNDSFSLLTVVENFTIFTNMKTDISVEFSLDDLSTSPESPTNLMVEEGFQCIQLSWQDNSHKEMRYVIERSIEPLNGFVPLDEILLPNTTQFSDTSIIPNMLYYYRVYAVNRYGDSDRSEVAFGMLSIPLPPFQLDLIDEDDTGIYITDNVTYKQVVRITGEAESDDPVDIFIENPLQRIASGIPVEDGMWNTQVTLSEGEYGITAVALDPLGNPSDFSLPLTFTIDITAPAAPVITGPLGTYNTQPTWGFSHPNDGALLRYRLYDEIWIEIPYSPLGTYQPGPLAGGAEYTYELQAQDTAGNWSESGSHTIFILNEEFIGLEFTGSWKRPYGKPSEGIEDFTVNGSYIYIATGQDIKIFNISDPRVPSFEGIVIPSSPEKQFCALDIYQNFLYTIGDNTSLLVYNLDTPSTPTFIGEISFAAISTEVAYNIEIHNNYLYLLISGQGLFIFNLDDPSSPALQGDTDELILPENLCDFIVQGIFVYIAAKEDGVCILDLTDIASPVLSTTIPSIGITKTLAVLNNTLYVAGEDQGIGVYDISDPSSPVEDSMISTEESTINLTVFGDTLFTGHGEMGIKVYNITDPFSPLLCENISVKRTSNTLKVVNNYLYVNSADGGIEVYDILNPCSPLFCSRIPTSEKVQYVHASENLAFISDGLMGVKVLDVSTPSNPVLLSAFETSGNIHKLLSKGTFLYIGDDRDGFLIYTITNPLNPVLTGQYSFEGINSFYIKNNLAYVVTVNSDIHIIDIENPVVPILLGTYSSSGQLRDILVTGEYAYITNYSSLEISDDLIMLNITNPESPGFMRYIDTLPGASGLYTFGSSLFVGHESGAVSKLDIAYPLEIEVVQINTSFSSVYGMWGEDEFIFVNDSTGGTITTLHYFDITAEVPNGEYICDHPANSLFACNNYLYLTINQNEDTLYILKR